jgi:hypothetical protein
LGQTASHSPWLLQVTQRFGDKVNPHIHLHTISADGAFDAAGVFPPMPFDVQGDIAVLTRLFAERLLDLMVRRKCLSPRSSRHLKTRCSAVSSSIWG